MHGIQLRDRAQVGFPADLFGGLHVGPWPCTPRFHQQPGEVHMSLKGCSCLTHNCCCGVDLYMAVLLELLESKNTCWAVLACRVLCNTAVSCSPGPHCARSWIINKPTYFCPGEKSFFFFKKKKNKKKKKYSKKKQLHLLSVHVLPNTMPFMRIS